MRPSPGQWPERGKEVRQIYPYSPRRRPAAALRDPASSLQIPGACCSLAAGVGSPGTRESRLLHSEHPRAPASDREAGEREGGRGTQLRGKGGGGGGGSAERTARRGDERGHPRSSGGDCRPARKRASAADPADPGTPACWARTAPSLRECGVSTPQPLAPASPSSFRTLPLLRPAPRAELRAPQWPLPAPPRPGATASPACLGTLRERRPSPVRLFRQTQRRLRGAPVVVLAAPLGSRVPALRVTVTWARPRRDRRAGLNWSSAAMPGAPLPDNRLSCAGARHPTAER